MSDLNKINSERVRDHLFSSCFLNEALSVESVRNSSQTSRNGKGIYCLSDLKTPGANLSGDMYESWHSNRNHRTSVLPFPFFFDAALKRNPSTRSSTPNPSIRTSFWLPITPAKNRVSKLFQQQPQFGSHTPNSRVSTTEPITKEP